jgi:hypothetical protein
MNKWLLILMGLLFLVVPVYLWIINFWGLGVAAFEFFKGGLVWFLVFIGLMLILIGIIDLMD